MIPRLCNIKPETAFIIIALIYGLSFLVIVPPFHVIDEPTHFFRASDVSEGHIIPEKVKGGAVVTITASMLDAAQKLDLCKYPQGRIPLTNITSAFFIPLNKTFKVHQDISIYAIVTYPPIPYLASALGMDVGKLFNLPVLFLLYIGRLMNLIVWLLLIYLAIKITPVHKWVMFLLALMPMTIFQGASLSADSFTIAVSFLVIAIFLKFAFDEGKKLITNLDLVLLFGLVLMLTLSKPFYFILIFLFFLIPQYKLVNRGKMFSTFAVMFLSIVVIESLWYLATHTLYVPENYKTSILGQMSYILSNPLVFPRVMFHTLWASSYTYLIEAVGHIRWVIFLPRWVTYSYVAVLIATAFLDKNEIKISRKQKFIIAGTFLFICFMIFAVEYIAWTPVGKTTVGGVQGRYFVPVVPLLFLLFYNNRIKKQVKGLNVFIVLFTLIILSFTVFTVLRRLYIF